jgi:hypothetical protein
MNTFDARRATPYVQPDQRGSARPTLRWRRDADGLHALWLPAGH